MALAILCSGQGGQSAKMFDLAGESGRTGALFAHAGRLLGEDPRTLVRDADPAALEENRTAQILCTLQALIAAELFDTVWPGRRCIAGYSVGELASWRIAGLLDPFDALDLADARARAMDAASQGEEGMVFVRGLSRERVERLCAAHHVAIAIANPDDAFVIAGAGTELAALTAEAARCGAQRVAPVGVRVASHTSRLAPAVPVFRAALERVRVGDAMPAGTRLISGIDGQAVLDVAAGLDKLARQVAEPVEWAACLAACVEAGATAFFELGPGSALADMASRAYPSLPARGFADFRSIEGAKTWLKGAAG